MKKLLYILLFVPLALFGQSFLSIQQDSPLELSSGWNMIGYSCYEPMNVTEAFSLIEDKVLIVKNNNGDAYVPEWSFNGIGDLIRNKGYQLKLTQAISDFQFCPFIVPLVYGCTDETAFNYNPNSNTDDGSCYPIFMGCLDSIACNFNDYDGDGESNEVTGDVFIDVNTDDGSCTYPEQGYDCEGNIIEELIDIIYAEGGIVFYLDETGTRGLVAAWEDLPGTYEWGCFEEYVNGADGTSIGTGYQNTMDIANNGCMTENGGITAAQAALDYESEGYSDWYLPSKDELYEIYNTIGTPIGTGIGSVNIGGFVNDYYWSSSEYNNLNAWIVNFADGGTGFPPKLDLIKVRPIRAFGNWTMGCMDSIACNYNPDANMADDSCTYTQDGYDCDGNDLQFCLTFDGCNWCDDYVDFGDNYDFNSESFSFTVWVKINQLGVSWQQNILTKGLTGGGTPSDNGFKISIVDDSHKIKLVAASSSNAGSFIESDSLSIDTWYFVSAVIDRTNDVMHLYIDDNFHNSTEINSLGELSNNGHLHVGNQYWSDTGQNAAVLDGKVSEVSFYDYTLNEEEILSLINCSPTGNEEGLVGYWNFNEGQGNTVYDLSGNDNHGTINGSIYSTDVPENNCE